MTNESQIDVAEAFADCVESMDGEILDRTSKGPIPFASADYIFRSDRVVAELKCLEEDIISSQEFKRLATRMHAKWIREGLLPPVHTSPVSINLREIPKECAYELLEPFKLRLESAVKKANKQIRETKKHLSMPNAKGLLLLANDGNLSMKPNLVLHLLDRILKVKCSSINSVIYFSANHPVDVPSISMRTLPWVDPEIEYRDEVSKNFRRRLRDVWFAHYSTLVHSTVLEVAYDVSNPSAIDNIKFVHKTEE